MENLNIILVTQARVGSSRLPRKVLLKIGDQTLLGIHLSRINKSKMINQVLVATTHEEGSNAICDIATAQGALCYKGSTNDVLDRFYKAAKSCKADWVVRVTSDCPLLDASLLDEIINTALKNNYDYCANNLVEDFPDGQDIEVFKMSALTKAWSLADKKSEREHVTPFIRENSDVNGGTLFRAFDYSSPENYNHIRMTVDEQADLDTMRWLVDELGQDKSWMEYTNHILSFADNVKNASIIRNEGYQKSLRNDH